jgi:hypothetical protein
MAEIKIAILERNALSRRLPDEAALRRQVGAVETERELAAQRHCLAVHAGERPGTSSSDSILSKSPQQIQGGKEPALLSCNFASLDLGSGEDAKPVPSPFCGLRLT